MQLASTKDAIFAQAGADAARTIFQNDNLAVQGYRMLVARLMNAGEAGTTTRAFGEAAGRAFEFAFPIVKVPTNVVAESGSYAVGALKAFLQYKAAGGMKGLTADQADYIARNLQKQFLGGALMATGIAEAQNFGGYYQQGDSKKSREVEADTGNLGGLTIPRWAFHTPAAQMLQFGATMSRVYDEDQKREGIDAGANAVMQAGKGLLDQIPFLNTPWQMTANFRDIDSAKKALGSIPAAFVPPDIAKLAKSMDDNTRRKPQGFLDPLKMKIPGWRQDVPESR
jgi:hypothetical protein